MTTLISMTALALFQQAGQRAEVQSLTGGGWLFMSAAWVFILILVFFTFSKVLRGGRK